MSIRVVPTLVQVPNRPNYKYVCSDNFDTFDIDEAVEHENKLVEGKKVVPYDRVWSIQEAINMAVAEDRVVRFLSNKSNKELRKGIIDIKGCKLLKPYETSNDIAVVPLSVDFKKFDFDEVD